MKKVLLSSLVFFSMIASAADIEGIRQAGHVRVDNVQTQIVGEQGFPSVQVTVTATFSNRCMVPEANELVSVINYSRDYTKLNIALGNESTRMCPMVYQPTTVTINLGQFTKPNDGLFSEITVNGVSAK